MPKPRAMKTPEDRSRFVGTVLILILLFLLFGAMLFWMYSVKLLTIPAGIAALLGIDQSGEETGSPLDTGGIIGMIKTDRPDNSEGIGFEPNYSNLRQAILDEPEAPGYRQELRVAYSEDNISTSVVIYRSGDKARVEIYEAQPSEGEKIRTELMIFDSTVYLLDDRTGETRSIPRSDSVSPENAAGLPSVPELLAIIEQFSPGSADETEDTVEESTDSDLPLAPLAASAENALPDGEERRSGQEIVLRPTEVGNLYYVGFCDNYLGTREEYYLSLENNVVIGHSVWYGDELLYSCETVSFLTDPSVWNSESLYRP